MSGNLVFKKAVENDIVLIHKLAEEIWRTSYLQIISAEQIEYMLGRMYSASALKNQLLECHHFYLAYLNHDPIGYFSYSENETGKFLLHKIYIKTNEQQHGIGKQMLIHLLSILPEKKELRLTVNRKNYKAINFYFKNGFIIEDAKDFDIGNGFFMKDFVMIRKTNA